MNSKTIGIKYICPSGNSGYAEAAKDYIIGLSQTDIPLTVSLMKMDNSNYLQGERNQIVNKFVNKVINYNKVIIHSTPEFWNKIYIEEKTKNKDVEVIGMVVWETSKIDDRWIEWINEVDRVVVPCFHNKEVFLNCNIIKPIEVVPHIFKPLVETTLKLSEVNNNDFVFYTIGQWSVRKGVEDTIKTYLNTFNDNDKVCLIVKTFKSNYAEEEKQKIKNRVNSLISQFQHPAKVVLITDECTDEEISAIHKTGSCYVSLCKSEGWGLGAFDAAGLGKSVIITGYGGPVDFLLQETVKNELISVEGMEWIPWYNNTQKWGNPDLKHASELMLLAKENQNNDNCKSVLKQQSEKIQKEYSYSFITQKLISFLNR